MRILFVSDNFPPERNAPATRVHEHACYWVKWGHEVTVLTCVPNFPEGKVYSGYRNRWRQEEWIDGIRVVRVKTFITANEGTLLRTLDYLSFMASAFIAGAFLPKPDVVIATSPQFFAAVAGCGLSGLLGRPYLLEVRDLWPASIAAVGALKESFLLRLLERVELFLYRKASAIVVVTNAFKEDLERRGVPPGKIAVVINGVDLPRYAPRPRDPELEAKLDLAGRFVVGYVGTHGMAHALEKVLDVAGRMREAAGIRFLFVGGGAEKAKLVEEAERRGLTNVTFLPPQPKERMPEIWSLCDVALVHLKNSPAFASVIPSKIFEAMGMGLPIVIASPKGEAGGIVEGDGAGIWVPPEDPSALEGAVLRLKDDSALYERCAAGSLAAAPRYSRERKAEEMIRVVERIGKRG
ncbi:MAG: glycosyltransferase WbuB [Deltaproteobacteria bacterium]|nr:MAG: glycosyltransferase WbuB [Deltaproteobacteria bacterium]